MPLGSLQLGPVQLDSVQLGSLPLGSVPLGSLQLVFGTWVPLGSVQLGPRAPHEPFAMLSGKLGLLKDARIHGSLTRVCGTFNR